MFKYLLGLLILCVPMLSFASSEQVWQESMMLAQQGQDKAAISVLKGASLQASQPSLWTQRFDMARRMLELRREAKLHSEYGNLKLLGNNQYELLLGNWLAQHPVPTASGSMIPGLIASIIPGSGHAWMGRWGDAGVSAMLVWPLLILTFWAARRNMGPVTVFFALITAWLWSGTVFSATSLAERGDFELYYAWWQQMWVASGLPSRPW
ncbi:MAG: hypothetical protein R8M46_06560 [Ghiorsea sp.]